MIVQTVQAGAQITPLPPEASAPSSSTAEPGQPDLLPEIETAVPTASPILITLPPSLTPTPPVQIPTAEIEIHKLGAQSRVVSPLEVSAYLSSKTGKRVRVELYGENGRVLARELKVFDQIPWAWANVNTKLDFEIPGVSEAGRLVIIVEDAQGRAMAVNSVDLILLSKGETQFTPASALYQAIVLTTPPVGSQSAGGKLTVNGLARVAAGQPLRVQLVASDGSIVGQRLAPLSPPSKDGYAAFSIELPYTVSGPTTARLTVFDAAEKISPLTQLASLEVMLGP
jgi:hypothetical protein